MLRKRIIFTLIYSEGYFMQSRNFRLQKVGNLNWLEKNYKFQNIAFALDELIVLNANRFEKKMVDFDLENGAIRRIHCADGSDYQVEAVLLATGHSARDIFELFYKKQVLIE